jgi:tripartite-type tricarboxylate transporter receptor subunit TctC
MTAGTIMGAVILIGAMIAPLCAQTYPGKPLRLIIPFPGGGGGADYVGRVIGQKLAERLGQPVVIENRPGAAGNIGIELVAKRPLTVEQAPRALARGCDPVAGCKRRT